MPISQARIIALINAGTDFEQALYTAVRLIQSECANHKAGRVAAEGALSNIRNMIQPVGLLSNPLNSPKILALEKRHFEQNARRNNRAAAKMAAKRKGEGHKPRARYHPPMALSEEPYQPLYEIKSTAPRGLPCNTRLTGSIEEACQSTVEAMETDEENQEEFGMIPTGALGTDSLLVSEDPPPTSEDEEAPPISYTPEHKADIDHQMAEAFAELTRPKPPDGSPDSPDDPTGQ